MEVCLSFDVKLSGLPKTQKIVFELNGAFYIFKYYSLNMSSQEKHYSV